jgi:hypothetical protein
MYLEDLSFSFSDEQGNLYAHVSYSNMAENGVSSVKQKQKWRSNELLKCPCGGMNSQSYIVIERDINRTDCLL